MNEVVTTSLGSSSSSLVYVEASVTIERDRNIILTHSYVARSHHLSANSTKMLKSREIT